MLLAHLLLCPNDIGVGVLVEMRGQEVIWQWRELLETRNGNIVNLAVFPLLEKLEVDLTRAEDMSSDLFWRDQGIGVGFGNVSLESRLSDKVGNVGLDEGVSEEGFREEDDELDCQCCIESGYKTYWFTELSQVLSSKDVEVVGGGTDCQRCHKILTASTYVA